MNWVKTKKNINERKKNKQNNIRMDEYVEKQEKFLLSQFNLVRDRSFHQKECDNHLNYRIPSTKKKCVFFFLYECNFFFFIISLIDNLLIKKNSRETCEMHFD